MKKPQISFFRAHYVGMHASSFDDFALKSELLHAVRDCGFEHPSEGKKSARFTNKRVVATFSSCPALLIKCSFSSATSMHS